MPVIEKVKGFSSLSLLAKLIRPVLVPAVEVSSRTVKVSDPPAAIDADRPSIRLKPDGKVRPEVVNAAVPVTLLLWDAYHHRLGTNPQEFALHTTGTLTLVFLLVSLAVTPLRKVLGLPWIFSPHR